jgi:gluconokinase
VWFKRRDGLRAAVIVILGGVAGTGKTTVGQLLANELGLPFLDADSFHDPASIEKMRANQPLTDDDRGPWLDRLNGELQTSGRGVVLACSALTEWSRRRLTAGLDDRDVRIVFLHGAAELLRQRLEHRHNHFAGADLLASQLATVELPRDALIVDVGQPVGKVVAEIMSALGADRR